jgi:hypothetical protein
MDEETDPTRSSGAGRHGGLLGLSASFCEDPYAAPGSKSTTSSRVGVVLSRFERRR